MTVVTLIVALVIGGLLVVIGAQNTQSVELRFLAWSSPAVPVVLALAVAMLAGVLITGLVSAPGLIRGVQRRRKLEQDVHTADHRAVEAITASRAATQNRPVTLTPTPRTSEASSIER